MRVRAEPMTRRIKTRSAGAPTWLVTFADLMSLLVCFFVLIISYSVPDIEKLKIAAGSIRDAFGITREVVVTGVVELDGNPVYMFAQDLAPRPLNDVIGPIPDRGRKINFLAAREQYWEDALSDVMQDVPDPVGDAARFEQIEQELRQAMQSIPDLARLADHLVIEHTPEGLRIQIVDQARMSMFPLGSAQMHAPTRALLHQVGRAVRGLPNKVAIAGHTDSHPFRRTNGYDNWSLSLDRADATRRVLLDAGLDTGRVALVVGKADTDHMFAADPLDARNRRISITLIREDPRPVQRSETRPEQGPVGLELASPAERAAGSESPAGPGVDFAEARRGLPEGAGSLGHQGGLSPRLPLGIQ